jgi:hypothetical protein
MIGPLAVYDITQRIGRYLGLEPEDVYLHRGTREGARALGLCGETVKKDQFPAAFQRLSAAEIEDCLCIFKDELKRVSQVPSFGRLLMSAPLAKGDLPDRDRSALRDRVADPTRPAETQPLGHQWRSP